MQSSYSSFKNDIKSFNLEEYIQNLNSSTYETFLNFINDYKEIESEDFKKPIFSQTTKFKKIPNNYKNYKSIKITREKEEKQNWTCIGPNEENDKISVIIKTYLNKISEDTYRTISTEFINELLTLKNEELFNILSKEIVNKCLFDNKFRHLYINLCFKIWTNRQLHHNMANIYEDEGTLSWEFNGELYEGFATEVAVRNDIYIKLNFKKYFLNYIQSLYKNKDIVFENLSEEDIFIKKKKVLLLVELVGIMYLEKYINFDIINIIIIDLLHINEKNATIAEIEYEALYNLIKLIKEKKTNYNDIMDCKMILNEYIIVIHNIVNEKELTKRSQFFLNEICVMLDSFFDVKKGEKENAGSGNGQNKGIFIEKLKNYFQINEMVELYRNLNNNDRLETIYKTIDFYLNQRKSNESIVKLLISLNDFNTLVSGLRKIIDNLTDIMLDVPNANEKLIGLVKNMNLKESNKLIDMIGNIKMDDSDEDSDEDSDDDSDNDACDDEHDFEVV